MANSLARKVIYRAGKALRLEIGFIKLAAIAEKLASYPFFYCATA
jgi:hypothetical protein